MAKSKTIQSSTITSCVIGGAIAVLLTALQSGIVSVFILNGYLDINILGIVALIIQLISAFFGVMIGVKITANNKILAGAFTAAGYYLVLLCCGLLFFDGIKGSALIGLISCAIGYLLALLLNSKGKTSRHRTRTRRQYR